MNLNALADRPAVSALSQRVCLDPYREMMSLFEHDRKYGARLARVLGKNSSATFKLAHYPAFTIVVRARRITLSLRCLIVGLRISVGQAVRPVTMLDGQLLSDRLTQRAASVVSASDKTVKNFPRVRAVYDSMVVRKLASGANILGGLNPTI
jgi:hypothetical protein